MVVLKKYNASFTSVAYEVRVLNSKDSGVSNWLAVQQNKHMFLRLTDVEFEMLLEDTVSTAFEIGERAMAALAMMYYSEPTYNNDIYTAHLLNCNKYLTFTEDLRESFAVFVVNNSDITYEDVYC